jgi:hypothetical protein
MKNSFTREYIDIFSTTHSSSIVRQLEEDVPSRLAKSVPPEWLEIVRRPGEASLRSLWKPANDHLPRFVGYLATSVEGAAIVEAYDAPVLLLALPDWAEEEMEPRPGFCWIGLPTEPALLEQFIEQIGPIPTSLESLWRVANFVNTKHPSNLCSLRPSHKMIETPEVFLEPSRANANDDAFECLKIAVTNDQMITCMTRPPGQRHWDDMLVERFRHTGEIFYGVKGQLDSMLSNQSSSDW